MIRRRHFALLPPRVRRALRHALHAVPDPEPPRLVVEPANRPSTGRLTVVIGRDAYAELERAARRQDLTPNALAGRMLIECLNEEATP